MVVVGGYGASTNGDPDVRTWATVIAALGGVLLSWATGTAYSRQQALAEVDDRLLTLSTQLGTETSNIELAVEQAQRGMVSSETCFALLSQSLNSLTNIVNQIQSQLGATFDPQGWIETREKIAELTRTISKEESPTKSDLDHIRERLSDISATLKPPPPSGIIRTGAPSQLVSESTSCPNCGAVAVIAVGSRPGATAQGRCATCGQKFNAHRSSSGGVFTRQLLVPRADGVNGHPPNREAITLTCSRCNTPMSVRVRKDLDKQPVICVKCGAGYDANTVTMTLEPTGEMAKVSAKAEGVYNSRPVTKCPECGARITAIIKGDDAYYGICRSSQLLIEVAASEYKRVKDELRTDAPS
jgi:transcription elongation factor Elf1